MEKPLSDSSVSLKLALIQKRCAQLLQEDDREVDALSLADDVDPPASSDGRDYFIER